MNKFLNTQSILDTHEEIENWNILITNKETELVIRNFRHRKVQGQFDLPREDHDI